MRRGPSVAVVGMVEVGTLLPNVTMRSSPCTLHMAIRRRPRIPTASGSGEVSGPNLLVVRCGTEGSVRTSATGCGRAKDIWRGTDLLLIERRGAGIMHKWRSTRILDGCNGTSDASIRRSPRVGPIAKERRGAIAAPALKVLILIAKGGRPGLGNDGRYGCDSICLLLGKKVGCCGEIRENGEKEWQVRSKFPSWREIRKEQKWHVLCWKRNIMCFTSKLEPDAHQPLPLPNICE